MIDRTIIRSAAVAALKLAVTSAKNSVYSPLDRPTQPGKYPLIICRTPRERKENVSPRSGPPMFFSTITLAVIGRVEATTEAAAELALESLSLQIENALLSNGQFIYENQIQQFSAVETSMEVRSESEKHYGETVVSFDIEVPQMFEPMIDAAGTYIGAASPALNSLNAVFARADTGVSQAGMNIPLPGA
jgi:hypothetical protein